MKPLAAGRFREALEPDAEQRLAHLDCRLGHPLPGQPDIGVEIEGDAVRGFELRDRRSPGVDFEHPHLHHRDEARQVLDERIGTGVRAGALRNLDAPDHRRHGRRRVLLVEAFLPLPCRTAHQAERPVPQLRQGPVADRRVIARQRQLGDLLLGIKNPVRVGQPHAFEGNAAVARGGRTFRVPAAPLTLLSPYGACPSFSPRIGERGLRAGTADPTLSRIAAKREGPARQRREGEGLSQPSPLAGSLIPMPSPSRSRFWRDRVPPPPGACPRATPRKRNAAGSHRMSIPRNGPARQGAARPSARPFAIRLSATPPSGSPRSIATSRACSSAENGIAKPGADAAGIAQRTAGS